MYVVWAVLLNVVCFLRMCVMLLCSVVGYVRCCDFCLICDACSWLCSFMSSMCVSSCRCSVLVSVVHAVEILSTVFSVIHSLLKFVCDASGDHMVETYSSMGLVMGLHVANIFVFCFPRVVDVSSLSTCIVLRDFVVVLSMFLLLC